MNIILFTDRMQCGATLISFHYFSLFAERKRRVYDQYGKDGLLGQNDRHHRTRRHDYDDLDFGFVFRSPDEVFREFFGNNHFDLFFGPSSDILSSNGRRGGGGHRHSHPQNTAVMNPFMGLMDDFFQNGSGNGFSSFSTFSNGGFGGGGGGGATKRTSTSTTFFNGKKIMTKR